MVRVTAKSPAVADLMPLMMADMRTFVDVCDDDVEGDGVPDLEHFALSLVACGPH